MRHCMYVCRKGSDAVWERGMDVCRNGDSGVWEWDSYLPPSWSCLVHLLQDNGRMCRQHLTGRGSVYQL